jgi:hypothetical protein
MVSCLRQGGPALKQTQVYPKRFGETIARLHTEHMVVS